MTEFERINEPRVEKILKMLDVIEKSAKSNRTDPHAVLAPIRERLGDNILSLQEVPAFHRDASPARAETVSLLRGWADAVEMARNAPLEHAVAAMGVIANRVEQELFERRERP